jgi:VWFA-related protein
VANSAVRTHFPASVLWVAMVVAFADVPHGVTQSALPVANMTFAAPAPVKTRTSKWSQTKDSTQPQFTIQTRIPLTIVDITVTDAKGNPVHSLQQSDFTILENNQPMHPNSFEEHRADQALPAAPPAKLDLPPNTFTNVDPAPPKAGPIDILLLDSLNTPVLAQRNVTQQMLDFLRTMPAGTRMAVFRLTTHLAILQGFTTDTELLKAAINKVDPTTAPLQDPWRDLTNANPPPEQKPGMIIANEGDQTAARAQYELNALNQIARYLSGLPGRKNLLWFGGSFPLQFPPAEIEEAFPDFTVPGPGERCPPPPMRCGGVMPQMFDFTMDLKSATDLLASAHVAVYPVDPHGLEVMGNLVRDEAPGWAPKNLNYMNISEHFTMDTVAEATGGKAFYNTNGFAQAAQQAINNGANFYTITYTPTNQALDTRFRTITVKVDRPNLHLDYRNGYYAIDPATTFTGKKAVRVTPMQAALMRGALNATQVLFKVRATQAAATEATSPADNRPNPKQMKPPYRRYHLDYVIDMNNMDFDLSPDGNYRCDFEYGVRVYNADGDEIVNSVSTTVSPILPPAVYRSMLIGGANAHQEIDVPATGVYFLRVGVHDLSSDRVGAIEIPTASVVAAVK